MVQVSHVRNYLPVSLEDVHNQVPVELSNLQLYHRSELSMSSHTHQGFKERSDMMLTYTSNSTVNANKHHVQNYEFYLLHGRNEQYSQCDEMQEGDEKKQVRHF